MSSSTTKSSQQTTSSSSDSALQTKIIDNQSDNSSPKQSHDTLPILLSLIDEGKWRQVVEMLEDDPSLARRQVSMVIQGENSRCSLSHLVCGLRDTPLSVIDSLVTLHPASLLQQDQRGFRLPIHVAILKDAPLEVIQYLCRARPQSLEYQDQEGNLPLHYAAMHGPASAVKLLFDTYPQGCAKANTRDRFPIHLVCDRCFDTSNLPIKLVDEIIHSHPQSLISVDRFGRTPLHLAASVRHPQLQLIQLLISEASETLLLKDKARKTPLICAKSGSGNRLDHKANDLVVASLMESTQKEIRCRRHKTLSKFFVTITSNQNSSNKTKTRQSSAHDEDLYCCYG